MRQRGASFRRMGDVAEEWRAIQKVQ